MYKIVEDYIDKLNELAKKARNANKGFLESCDKKEKVKVRDSALELLNDIFSQYEWSEEFVTAFAVYCNFFILHGLHIEPAVDFGLEKVYDANEMDAEDRQYLEYIRFGIFEQNIDHFWNAYHMSLYNFDILKVYVYVLSFLELCSKDKDDFEIDEGKDDILFWLREMEYCMVIMERIRGSS